MIWLSFTISINKSTSSSWCSSQHPFRITHFLHPNSKQTRRPPCVAHRWNATAGFKQFHSKHRLPPPCKHSNIKYSPPIRIKYIVHVFYTDRWIEQHYHTLQFYKHVHLHVFHNNHRIVVDSYRYWRDKECNRRVGNIFLNDVQEHNILLQCIDCCHLHGRNNSW